MNAFLQFQADIKSLGLPWSEGQVFFHQQGDNFCAEYQPGFPEGSQEDMTLELRYGALESNRGEYVLTLFSKENGWENHTFDGLNAVKEFLDERFPEQEELEEAEEEIDYKKLVDEAVQSHHHVNEDGSIDLYADYRETGEFLHKTLYEQRDSEDLENIVHDTIWEAYTDSMFYYENEILTSAGLRGAECEDEAREYLREAHPFNPPYEHFMSQDLKVNIMLATDEERGGDCVSIHEQYVAMANPDAMNDPEAVFGEENGLTWLLAQQGYTMDQLRQTMKEFTDFFYDEDGCVRERVDETGQRMSLEQRRALFNQDHSAFLTSVCQELENQSYSMGVLTVLARMSIQEFIDMQRGERLVTMPKNCEIGIFNPWNGSGSVLEIELEKDLVFPTGLVRDVQIEGVKPEYEYTVDGVYGLIGSAWKEPVSIVPEYDLGFGYKGNGITVWNRSQEEYGDYKNVAHISAERVVTYYDQNLPETAKQKIEEYAAHATPTISATQDQQVFHVPPIKAALDDVIKTCEGQTANEGRLEKGAVDLER